MQEGGFGEKPSTLKQKSTKREIVEVKGGRILRSIGRKDRHSKVCTAKGPRDRRVRLSANTAIQFYDVQDRLGYGRPSEAVDWLMKEAKAAIDALNELPNSIVPSADDQQPQSDQFPKSGRGNQIQQHLNEDPIKGLSFFTPSSSRSQTQCFNPSLQSCQNPLLLQPHLSFISSSEPALFSVPTSLSFDVSTPSNWPNPQTMEIGRTQRMITWASNSSSGNGEEREGFVIDSMPLWQQQRILDQDQLFSQGGTLQSSYSPSVFSSMNPQLSNLSYDQIPSSIPSSGTSNLFTSDGFSGFCILPQIQGGEEKHIPATTQPSSATCVLHCQHY